jgi:hypothetical protein
MMSRTDEDRSWKEDVWLSEREGFGWPGQLQVSKHGPTPPYEISISWPLTLQIPPLRALHLRIVSMRHNGTSYLFHSSFLVYVYASFFGISKVELAGRCSKNMWWFEELDSRMMCRSDEDKAWKEAVAFRTRMLCLGVSPATSGQRGPLLISPTEMSTYFSPLRPVISNSKLCACE